MSLSDLASIGSLVSGIAVLVSLVYLAQQTRQNSKHTRALIQQGRLERITDQQMRLADGDLAAAWLIANGVEATPAAVQRRQFQQQCVAYYVGWDDTLSQYDEGLVSEEQFARFRGQMVNLLRASPGMRAYFGSNPLSVSADRLQTFVAGLLDEAKAPERS